MSYQTPADDRLEQAKKHITTAVDLLSEIVVARCPGYCDFTIEYQKNIRYSFDMLLNIRDTLKA